MRYLRKLLSSIRLADTSFSLIDEGDKILVGVSGGKDSLALLLGLSLYGQYSHKKYEFYPVMLDLGFPKQDLSELEAFCKKINHPLIVEDSSFVYDVLKTHQKEGKHLPCSICSRMKKAAMNNLAIRMKCNKVSFAHHLDDALETLFMNMIHGGRVATFEPKMYLERTGITFIRPLLYVKEEDIVSLVKEQSLPVLKSTCPANFHTEREEVKNLLASLYERNEETRENFRRMLTNYKAFQLYFSNLEEEFKDDPSYSLKPAVMADSFRKGDFSKKKKYDEEFLILHNHEVVGDLSYRFLNDHRIEIGNLHGDRLTKRKAIKELIYRLGKAYNPLTLSLVGEDKSLKEEFGFKKAYDPQLRKETYLLKVYK